MKICFITNNISECGGVQRVLTVVANGLADKHEVSIMMTSPYEISKNVVYSLNNNVKIISDKRTITVKHSFLFLKALRYINRKYIKFQNIEFLRNIYFPNREISNYNDFFKEGRFDVIIGVQARAAAMVSLLDVPGKKIGWMHNNYDAYFNTPNRFQWRQELLYNELLPNLDKLIVLTKWHKENYANGLKKKCYIDNIYNPLSFESAIKSDLNNHRLLFVGRLQYEVKGLELLVEIIKKIKAFYPNVILDVVGDGPDAERFKEKAISEDVITNINMLGMQADVVKYYLNSDVLLLTSKNEAFGLVLTEAMECGVPVISFNTEGPSEIIKNDLTGYIIENFDVDKFVDKLLLLIKNDEIRYKMGYNATKRAKEFSIKNILKKWDTIFCEAN